MISVHGDAKKEEEKKMSNKKYNNFYNQKPAENPNTPAEEIKELKPVVTEEDENLNSEEPAVEQEETELPEVEETNELDVNVDVDPEDETEDETETEEEEENSDSDEEESAEEESETKNVQIVKVAIAKLNVREAADKDSRVVEIVVKNDKLELRESTSIDGFYAVKTASGQNGYCMVDFVELV